MAEFGDRREEMVEIAAEDNPALTPLATVSPMGSDFLSFWIQNNLQI